MSQDGIEIHFDKELGCLQLACEPDAFAAYRSIACEHLKDFPDIPTDRIIELNIVDTVSLVARRSAPKRRIRGLVFGITITVILALAIFGACTLFARLSG